MAINRVDYPLNLTDQDDFTAHNTLIETRFCDQTTAPIQVRDGVIPQGVVLQIGGVVYRADSNENINGIESAYVRITPNGATASAEYVDSLAGVTWNAQYNGYYDTAAPAQLYLFDEGLAFTNGEVAGIKSRNLRQDEAGNINIGGNVSVAGHSPLSRLDKFDSTGSGTFTVPNDVSVIHVIFSGGGGGGGASGPDGDENGASGGSTVFNGDTALGGGGGIAGSNSADGVNGKSWASGAGGGSGGYGLTSYRPGNNGAAGQQITARYSVSSGAVISFNIGAGGIGGKIPEFGIGNDGGDGADGYIMVFH